MTGFNAKEDRRHDRRTLALDELRKLIDAAAIGPVFQLVFDFHSLRCQCATLADAAGVSPRVVQRMMRHSTLELTGRYTRPRAVDIEAATSMLPSLKPEAPPPNPWPRPGPIVARRGFQHLPTSGPESMAATGTIPAPVFEPTATRGATRPEGGEPDPFAGKQVLATRAGLIIRTCLLIERTSETRRDEMNLFGIVPKPP